MTRMLLMGVLTLAGMGTACGQVLPEEPAPVNVAHREAVRDWGAVTRLRKGASVVVGSEGAEESCTVVGADAGTLTCASGDRAHVVYPVDAVETVYEWRRTSKYHWVRMVGLGTLGFLMGGAITDDGLNWPAAILGGLGAGLSGLLSGTPRQTLHTVYRRW